MKYIRTKDGIYEADFEPNKKLNNYKKCADTIEELCDEFVVEADDFGISQHDSHSIKEKLEGAIKDVQAYKSNFNTKQTIYGAIWTDKGLIYVAKMNDKGELELL